MELISIEVYRNRFAPDEIQLGRVVFDGKTYDYSDLVGGADTPVKAVLESPFEEVVGSKRKESYGKHAVVTVELVPFAPEHLLAIANQRRDDSKQDESPS